MLRPTLLRVAPVFSLVAVLLLADEALAKRMRITVSGAEFQPFPLAVPNCAASSDPAQSAAVTALLRQDVDLARHFLLVPPNTYLASASASPAAPELPKWQNVGASGVIFSELVGGRANELRLNFVDAHNGARPLARVCALGTTRMSACVHAFLDELVTLLTGEPGIFQTRLAVVRREGPNKVIHTCDMDGTSCTLAVAAGKLSLLPAWDATGTSLLFTSYLSGRPWLYRQLLGGGRPELLSGRKGLNTGAAASPDGRRIALTLSQDGQADIYVMNRDGSGLKQLTHAWGQDVSPTWSPDGSLLAFVSSRTGHPHIYTMRADGSEQRRLTFQGTYNQEPDWSPRQDGKIVFTARDEHLKYDLFAVTPATGQVTRLTQDEGDNDSPSFAPDGRHIVFTSTRGSGRKKGLYVMDEEGHKVRRIAAELGEVETPAWGPRPASAVR